MIDNVVAALGLELDLTDEEITDVLWLAVQMQQFGDGLSSERVDRNGSSENKGESKEPKKPLEPATRSTDRDVPVEKKEEEQKVEVHSKNNRTDDASSGRSDELQLRISDARSLQKPLELARSLRPLMRRVPSHLNTLLDEEATVRRIAEEKIWVPVLRPALEPWLDLALVIDESASMLMWKHTIAELGHFLSSYGVFRDVRIWKLGTDKSQKACIYAGVSADSENSAPRSPSELIEANGRCLVLVVSDCIAPIWHNGSMIPALQTWARSGMVAILQMLPDWLWGRTALNRGVVAKFSALTAGVPNYQLTTTTVSTWYDIDLETCVKIPVVTLEPEKFTAWAEMLAGKGGAWSAGIVFEPEVFSEPEPAIAMEVTNELDAEDRVHLFRLTASPIARRLAGLLAAAPSISLPIVRILQSKVLTQSQPVHVAEVFLGGLLKPLSEVTTKTNPNYLQYDFIEGVRDLLLESVPSSEIINVVAEVSDFIASRLGVSLEEFAAVIRNPQQVENTEIAGRTRPFALLTAQILRRLGGEYVRFAEQVEQVHTTSISQSQTTKKSIDRKVLNVPYFSQMANQFYPVLSNQATSIAMALSYHGIQSQKGKTLADEIYQWLEENEGGNNDNAAFAQVYHAYGFDGGFTTDRTWQEIKNEIDKERPVLVTGWFTSSGHFVCIIGYDEEGYIVHDPAGTYYEDGYDYAGGNAVHYSNKIMQRLCADNDEIWTHFIIPRSLTAEQIFSIAPDADPVRVRELLPHLNRTMVEFRINTRLRQAYFIATIADDSDSFRFLEELTSGEDYEFRKDLGNVYVGDGTKFKGRGLIQIVGKSNYRECGRALEIDLVNQPERLSDYDLACRSAGWFWSLRNLNEEADNDNPKYVFRKLSNSFGVSRKLEILERAKKVLLPIIEVSLEDEFRSALSIEDEQEKARVLADLIARSPEISSQLLEISSAINNEQKRISTLISLIPHLSISILPNVLEIIRAIKNTFSRFFGLEALISRLPEVLPEAIDTVYQLENAYDQCLSLLSLFNKYPSSENQFLLNRSFNVAVSIEDEDLKSHALVALTAELSHSEVDILQGILNAAINMEHKYCQSKVLVVIASRLSDTERKSILLQALGNALQIKSESYKSQILANIADQILPSEMQLLQQLIHATLIIQNEYYQSQVLESIVRKIHPTEIELLEQVIEAAKRLENEDIRSKVLALANKKDVEYLAIEDRFKFSYGDSSE